LIKYAYDYHGLSCNHEGKAHCPFHKPDKNPSFVINFDGGIWKWFDFHDNSGGSIVEFEARFAGISDKKAIAVLLKRFGNKKVTIPIPSQNNGTSEVTKTTTYIYKDINGIPILRKDKKLLSDGRKIYMWMHKEKGKWLPKKGEYDLIPYKLDEFSTHKKVVICEGEKDCCNISKLGIFATTAPAGAGSWPDSLNQYFIGFTEIIFLYDVGVEEAVLAHASILKKTYPDKFISIASVPMEKKNSDITDFLEQQHSEGKDAKQELEKILSAAKELKEPVEEVSKEAILETSSLEKIFSKPVSWLWPNRLPSGKISLLVGDPGTGKSYLSLYIASLITTGRPWPDGSPAKKGTVILLTAEDGIADTVRPRCDEMKADVSKIIIVKGTSSTEGLKLFNIPNNVSLLKNLVKKIGNVLLIIFDPVNAYFDRSVNTDKDPDIRRNLTSLVNLAEEENLSILFILHLNKNEAAKAVFRVMGSMGFVGSARSVWAISRDEEDGKEDRRLLTPIKTNLSINPTSLAFYIVEYQGIVFEKEPVNITAERALQKKEKTEPGAIDEAIEFLKQMFEKEEKITSNEIYRCAGEERICDR